ncbi:phage tail protein [Paenibacillus sp. GCM10023250]|uniref:phage tail protein n=1 Tax=Paenibacillus sp. GCM10023250 TaxID=3252648 RepID=UPI00360F914B
MATNEQNEFTSLTINHRAAWEEGLRINVETRGQDRLTLRTMHQNLQDAIIEAKALPHGTAIADFAIGPCGTLYLLDAAAGVIYRYDSIDSRYEEFVCLRSYCAAPTSIAYACGGIIVADRAGSHRLLHFSELNGQLTWRVGDREDSDGKPLGVAAGQSFQPDQIEANAGGLIYALDAQRCRVVHFDGHGKFRTEIGVSELGGKQPIAISVSANGTLYALELQARRVLAFAQGEFASSFDLPPVQAPTAMDVDAQGFLYLGESRKLLGEDDDRSIFKLSLNGEQAEVLAAYRGNADRIRADGEKRLYILDREAGKITVLSLTEVLYRAPGNPLAIGTYYSKAFDKTESRTHWHKLVLDADLPPNTQIEVSYVTDDEEIGNVEARTDWSEPQINPTQMLILRSKKRFLWIKLALVGSENESPRIRSVQAVFPRTSYLRYLPAVYQEEENSRDFLERYLSMFEAMMASSERQIDGIARWFDADVVGGDSLRWLASWLAIAYDEHWPDDKLRQLIHAIPGLYGKRGTRDGMEELIRLFTGIRPIIVEQYRIRCAEDPEIVALLERLFGTDPYSFCVLLKPDQIRTEGEYATVKRIVDTEKPAHTNGGVLHLQPYMYLDMHTYVGINSELTEPEPRLETGVIPRDAVLRNPTPFGQVGSSTLKANYSALA